MHIYHIKPSYDPIFPATDPYRIPEYHEPYYYNSDPRAQALACVDTTELCSPDGKTCWSMTSGLPAGIPDTPGYWFMKWSLEASNVYDAIKWRLGSALLAQQKVSSSVSQPLSDRHWEKEAERLFTTSLARIQSDAWSIATAEGRNEPGYIEVTHDEGRGRLCGIYKFKSIGFKNVSLAGFVLLLMVPFLTLLFSLEVNTAKKVFCSCCCYPRTRGKPQGEVRDSQAEVGDSQDELEPSRGEAGGSQYKDDYPKTFSGCQLCAPVFIQAPHYMASEALIVGDGLVLRSGYGRELNQCCHLERASEKVPASLKGLPSSKWYMS